MDLTWVMACAVDQVQAWPHEWQNPAMALRQPEAELFNDLQEEAPHHQPP
jgi:hypothetical protein